MEKTEELRKSIRIPLNLEVHLKTAQDLFVHNSENFTYEGAFIRTDKPLSLGTELALRFTLPSGPTIEILGRVVHHVEPDRAMRDGVLPGMGVHFVVYRGEGREQLLRHLEILLAARFAM